MILRSTTGESKEMQRKEHTRLFETLFPKGSDLLACGKD